MPDVLDIFAADAFKMASLTKTVNHMDFKPGRLGALGLFQEEGIPTTTVIIEEDFHTLTLIPVSERGAPPSQNTTEKRKARSFIVPHIIAEDKVMADEVQNVRAYAQGMSPSEQLLAVQQLIDRKLAKIRNRIEATLEFHRIGALAGKILDADGTSVIFDLFAEFGVVQQIHNMVLDTGTTNVLVKIREAQRKSLDALGSAVVAGWRAICGDSFYDKLVGHGKVEDKYLNFQAAAALRDDSLVYGAFPFGGVIWENYRGSVGGVTFVPTTKARLYPVTTAGELFVGRFGPGDYIDRANQNPPMPPDGAPIEARQEMMPMGKGVKIEAQSNPLYLCTKPRAVIELNENT